MERRLAPVPWKLAPRLLHPRRPGCHPGKMACDCTGYAIAEGRSWGSQSLTLRIPAAINMWNPRFPDLLLCLIGKSEPMVAGDPLQRECGGKAKAVGRGRKARVCCWPWVLQGYAESVGV